MERKENLMSYFDEYKKRLNNLLDLVSIDDLEKVVSTIVTTFKNGKTVYVCGNGGSAATASHIQADFSFFVRYFTKFRPKVRALTDNVPMITAVGNDTSYNDIFVEQLKGHFEEGDAIICISASGNSENVVRAAEFANKNGGQSIGFIGFTGGKLKDICTVSLYTPNTKGAYGPIEDLHMIYDHLIVNFLAKDEEFLAISNKLCN
jgi:D-sedoheptulose 7-phosphate isomerase